MYKAIIIGAGPGGFECAREIAKLGGRVALVEYDEVGGTCTNKGCIPTKALVASVEFIEELQSAKRKGIDVHGFSVDYKKIFARKDRIVKTIVKGIEQQIAQYENIDLYKSWGAIVGSNSVKVGDKIIEGENIVIATGSKPNRVFTGPNIHTSAELLDPQKSVSILAELFDDFDVKKPKSLVIIGGGIIGVELSQIYRLLGLEVTIIESSDSVLGSMDIDLQAEATAHLKRKGIKLITGSRAKLEDHTVIVNDQRIHYDSMLCAIGRKPDIPKKELEAIGVELEDNAIPVNLKLQTNVPNIYAIGDVTNVYQLAHVATWQGMTVAENIMGISKEIDYRAIPGCVYTIPEIASVGAKEQDLNADDVIIKKVPYSANAKARCAEKIYGFLKIIAEKGSEKILGVHIVGDRATDLIINAATLLETEATLNDIRDTIHPHPTFAELFFEAANLA